MKDLIELVTRKKASSFIEKILRYFEYDFDHDRYKDIVYGNLEYKTKLEEKYTNYIDAYLYLIRNSRNQLTKSILNKYFYIIFESNLDETIAYDITFKMIMISNLSAVEMGTEMYLYLNEKLINLKKDERTIISLMFVNYILVKNNIEMIKFNEIEIKNLLKLKKREEIYLAFINQIKNNQILPKGYLNNLKKLETREIIKTIKNEEIYLKRKYMVENIFIYGSYSKGINRIDSDIDLLISLSNNLTYLERVKIIEKLNEYFFNKFKRFIDIQEYRHYISDEIIKELKNIEKVI